MLELKVQCTRFKKLYSYNTHSNNNDWLNAIKKKKQGEIQILSNLVLI